MSNIIPFNFESNEIRAVIIDNNPWFVASDVCNQLEIRNTSQATSSLDDDEKLPYVLHISGQNRNVILINESGLYSLVLTSRKPEAKKFKKWITNEVLPEIRKTGSYNPATIPNFEDPYEAAIAWASEYKAKRIAQEQLAIAAPKAEALDRIADSNGLLGIREAAKVLKIKQSQLVTYLLDYKVLYRDQHNKLQTYQYSIERGLTKSIVSEPRQTNNGDIVFSQPKLTQKLITRIATWIENGMPSKAIKK